MTTKATLGIDPGTNCGWAVVVAGRVVASGTWDLSTKRHEGAGMRYLRFRKYLSDALTDGDVALVGYEEVRRHAGTSAAHVYGGITAVLQEVCETRGIPYTAIPVGTVKRRATGKGNADKEAMIASATRLLGVTPGDDNEADACWIAIATEESVK